MADARSSLGETDSEVSSSSRLPKLPAAVHVNAGGEQKATIHRSPPGSRPRTLPPLDLNTPDDLTRIRGIDRALADKLRRTGITHFDQIAEWSPTDVRSLSAALTLGRSIYQQNWIEQAARLVKFQRDTAPSPPAHPAAQAADRSASNPQRSITSLIASAASAIRAHVRINQPDEGEGEGDLGQKPIADPAMPKAVTPLLPPRTIDAVELASRISAEFRQIGAVAGLAVAGFPGPGKPHVAIHEAAPKADTLPPPEREVANDTAPEPAIEPAPIAGIVPRLPDDLCLICDLPRHVSDRLNALGVFYFSEIASFNADDIAALSVDCALGERINRECWVEQAAILATGAVTKAANLRAHGEPSYLTPYPPAPLQCHPEAFAALIPPPAVIVSANNATATAAIADGPCPPKSLAKAPARNLATLLECAVMPAAPKQPPVPALPHDVIETAKPAIAAKVTPAPIIDAGPAPKPQVALSDTPPETPPEPVPEPEPTPHNSAITASPAHRHDQLDVEFTDYEEAEVIIRPRTRKALTTPASFAPPATKSATNPGSEADQHPTDSAVSPKPDSLSSTLSNAAAATDADPDDQSGYLRHVGEASVDIVPARPATHSQRPRRQPTSPDIGTAATPADPATAPKSADSFLKALRGR